MCSDEKDTVSSTPQERAWAFALAFLPKNLSYHNHKETMAHAALLVEFGFLAALLTTSHTSSFDKFLGRPFSPYVSALFLIFVHIYIRWQLRQRRTSAILDQAFQNLITQWIITPPSEDDLKPYEEKVSGCCVCKKLIDHLWPYSKGTIPSEKEKKEYVKVVAEEYFKCAEKFPLIFSEIILAFLSLSMVAVFFVYSCFLIN
jgi:hypothetical protein